MILPSSRTFVGAPSTVMGDTLSGHSMDAVCPRHPASIGRAVSTSHERNAHDL